MNPATIAIIPLALIAAGIWAAWFINHRPEEDMEFALIFGTLSTLLTLVVLGFVAYLAGVVVFDDWAFIS